MNHIILSNFLGKLFCPHVGSYFVSDLTFEGLLWLQFNILLSFYLLNLFIKILTVECLIAINQ